MRYIGNKTRLLNFIGSVLDEASITGGCAFDAFAGTASVGRYLKSLGYAVSSCDLMTYSFVFQKAYTEIDRLPDFSRLFAEDEELARVHTTRAFVDKAAHRFGGQRDLFAAESGELQPVQQVLLYLDSFLDGLTSFMTTHYSPGAEGGRASERMFFTPENARRIDAMRTLIHEWRVSDLLDDDEYYLLLACLLEATDAVANTTGVYAAYIKTWQANARRVVRLEVPDLVLATGLECRAHQGSANDAARGLGPIDLLYLDPPYNTRQYSSYYHVPEILAKGWFEDEPEVRGKTGLIADGDKKSAWSTKAGCVDALAELLHTTKARHILMSYNSEGIIPEADIQRVFRDVGIASTFQVFEQQYARYRSDGDYEGRQYSSDVVRERIYYVAAARSAQVETV